MCAIVILKGVSKRFCKSYSVRYQFRKLHGVSTTDFPNQGSSQWEFVVNSRDVWKRSEVPGSVFELRHQRFLLNSGVMSLGMPSRVFEQGSGCSR